MSNRKYELAMKLLEVVFEHPEYQNCSKNFYSLLNNGEAKIKQAIDGYAQGCEDEMPFACYDDTLFGGGDDGFLFTLYGVHTKNVGVEKLFYSYADIHDISLDDCKIRINSEACISVFASDEEKENTAAIMQCIVNIMQYIMKKLSEPAAPIKMASGSINPDEDFLGSLVECISLAERISNVNKATTQYRYNK